jgi:hypothetical protein
MTGEVKMIKGDLSDLLLLFCGITGSLEFDVYSHSILSVISGTEELLIRTASADSCTLSRAHGFFLFLLFTGWETSSSSPKMVL